MIRKDCDISSYRGKPASVVPKTAALLGVALCALANSEALAGQLRVWTSAVVVGDSIKLGDLVELRGIDSEEETALRNLVITEAPPPGGSRIIHHAMIRSALGAKGINLANVTLSGSAQCEVRRPAIQHQTNQSNESQVRVPVAGTQGVPGKESNEGQSLRQAIEDHFNRELTKYGGKAELLFDRADNQILDLTAPPMQFQIHREKSPLLGLCALQVEIFKDGKVAQRVPLVVRTALSRSVVTARRAINQGATIAPADVDLMPVSFTRLEDLGVDDTALVLGQRAKRFVPAGSTLELEMLEAVPLVLRGQLITLISQVGGVRVVTTAKAGANGMRGETIRVRSVDDSKVELDAVVTGPGEARAVGAASSGEDSKPRLVLGGRS